jgi:hypothetical protein
MSLVSGVRRFVEPAGEAALDMDTPLHQEGDLTMGGIVGCAQPPVNAES